MTTQACDLLVVGSGAAGLSAAVTAAHHGLRVVLVEKAPVLGGTSAWSGGWIWAPCNPVVRQAGIIEPLTAPETYLATVLGPQFNPALVKAFLTHAPRMVGFFAAHTALQFEPGTAIPDTYSQLPGAGQGGRSVIAAPYDGRALGAHIAWLRRPLPETALMGLTIQAGADLRAFMTVTRSGRAAWYVARRFGRHLWDLARHGRGMQLRNGNALVARLLRSALDRDVVIMTQSPARRLLFADGRVSGAVVAHPDGDRAITARRGVVLATGGFTQDAALVAAQFPAPSYHRTLAVPEATGDGLRLAMALGGVQNRGLASPGAWCPVSVVPRADGSTGVFPHIIDRGKPGILAVLRNGRRFCNEGLGYHDYVRALLAAAPDAPESWLICSHATQRRYGLGIARPAPLPVGPWLRNGYLRWGKSLDDLAAACGIDAAGLRATIAEWNQHAIHGQDPLFGRGTTAYMRLQGDPTVTPNPCVAPFGDGPYYAVRVIPGSFGTFAGLTTDERARVLDGTGAVIPGLYAAGGDMASVMGGHYPAGGINLGPALTFGYVAALDAAGVDLAGGQA